MAEIGVRWASPADAGEIVRMVKALAVYEKEPVEVVSLDEAAVLRDGFPGDGKPPRFECLIAELDGRAVGLALFFANYSTWAARPGIYVEDLYVDDVARGHGLGKALMAAIAGVARARGCGRIDLNVMHWNPTREFYHRLGLRHMQDWLPYRLNDSEIATLAAAAPAAGGPWQ